MHSLDRKSFINALLLAWIAGIVDVVGFLQLGGFFVSFMSGNSTRLGLGIGSSFWREAGLAGGLIATFVGGVSLGSLIGQRSGERSGQVLLFAEGLLLSVAALCHQFATPTSATVPMVVAMGIANSVLQRNGEARFGVTYMTGALVRVGQGIAAMVAGGGASVWKPYAAIWLCLVIGATVGAMAYPQIGGMVLWFPALLLFVLSATATGPKPQSSPWKNTGD